MQRIIDGYPEDAALLPCFDAAEDAADVGRMLYDSLERLLRETRDGCVSSDAITDADAALVRARGESAIDLTSLIKTLKVLGVGDTDG